MCSRGQTSCNASFRLAACFWGQKSGSKPYIEGHVVVTTDLVVTWLGPTPEASPEASEDTAGLLSKHTDAREENGRVFPHMPEGKGAKMVRDHLEAAGIPYKTSSGKADFHALRHTFLTNLANSGVHPKTAQALARHSTITLTMDRYTHVDSRQRSEAVAKLPPLSVPLGVPNNRHKSAQTGSKSAHSGVNDNSPSCPKTSTRGHFPVVPPRGLEPRTHGLRILS